MSDLTLYFAAPTRALTARWMLEEVGAPYELKVIDLQKGEQRQADYLAVNPMGKVPALRHGDSVTTETAAICCYLADAFPQAKLAVPVGDPARGPYLKWLFFGPSCFEPAMTDKAFPRQEPPPPGMLGWGDFESVLGVIEAGLAPGPWLMGDRFTAADVTIGAGISWGTKFGLVPARPAFAAYLERIESRPAYRRAMGEGVGA